MEAMSGTDALAIMNSRNGYGDGYGYGMEWIWIIIIFAFMNNGWGNGFGGFGGGVGNMFATDIDTRFLERDVFNTNQNVSNSACQTQRDVLENRYTNQLGVQSIISSQKDCCCETNRNIDSVRYDNLLIAKDMQYQLNQCCCDLRAEGLANTQKIIDLIQQDKIDQLREQVNTTSLALNNANLANSIVSQILPRAVPAYPSCSPFVPSYYGFGGYANNSCGCGCGNTTVI